ncbi:MAG TPA: hypothetical protein PLC18_14205, partial [Sediminibacterium sp.]|uniref:hypothetical protein n=1 Tax=Sediminibacterium sp. TaxID=1917865 RepID=UPI002CEC545B
MNFDALSLQFKTAKPLILLRAKSAPFTLSFLYKVFKEPIEKPLSISSRWLALYLVAPLSTLVGGLWMVNGWRINRIGKYLQDIIAVKINIILNSFVSINGLQPKIQTLEWESPNQRLKYKWQRRSIDWFIYLMTFVFSGFLSQILLLKDKTGSIITQISQLEFPV